jgi:histidyl-tRNA synthetase
LATGNKSLKGQMRQANSLGIAYALILGKQELSKRSVVLRDMRSGEQKIIPLGEIARILKKLSKNLTFLTIWNSPSDFAPD